MLMLLATSCLFAKADVFTEEYTTAKKGAQVKTSVKADTYYIISGIDQSSREYYLYDNGGQVKGSASFQENTASTGAHIWILSARGSEWVITNVATGNKMNLGASNGSAIKMSSAEQTNAIYFGSDGYATILNANGQAIDVTANGANPTTWTGTKTPSGSRRLKIYEAEDVKSGVHKSLSLLPAPKSVVVGDGEFALKHGFSINVMPFSDRSVQNQVLADVARFISTINKATGLDCKGQNGASDIVMKENTEVALEGYILDITQNGVVIEASTSDGVYYAMQSLMRLLPENVILGMPGESGAAYSLPVARIVDEPRFAYRGFMLDVSRHFFSIEQVKKMIDLMAIYKMNVFHWHLTDDQGWRAEIKQYPLLTSTGAERRSSYDTPITKVEENGHTYWTGSGAQTNRKYGPFYYTQEEMKDVVRYATERHIDILPEVDMPGHFVAALAAYPQFSCHPNSAPQVWINGGISSDVLNVANPEAVQFAKNIITELCEIFPYPYFHIGGDECPTSQWESNAQCQAKLASLGKTSYRALQTDFIREINEHLATLGKKIFCWNESITDNGADLDLMKRSGATIMCWTPCQSAAAKAASMGLNAIITEYGSGCYYINRRQSNDYGEPTGAGGGGDDVFSTYNYVPVPSSVSPEAAKYYIGVQGTFWTEHVSSNEYLEYAALPRFMCIAEAGWTPQEQKNWNSFVKRMTVDTRMLDLGGYVYARHWMDDYVPRQVPAPIIADGSVVTFTNNSADRGRCLRDDGGVLNGQGTECTEWTLESAGSNGKFYIRSNVSGKYLYASNGNSGTMVELSNSKTEWAFDSSTMSGYVAICYNSTSGNAVNNNVTNTTKARLFAHGSGNGASFWAVASKVDDKLKDGEKGVVVYNYYHRGITVATQEFQLVKGSSYPSFLEYMPKGYSAQSAIPLEGVVNLKREAIEIPVDRVPEQGRFYRFLNTIMNSYISTDEFFLQTFISKEPSANTIFFYDNERLMAYERGLFMSGAELAEVGEDGTSMAILPSQTKTTDMYNIISEGEGYLRLYSDQSTPNALGTKANAAKAKAYDFSSKYVLSLPAKVGEGGWVTFSAPVAVVVPQGCKAYVATSYEEGSSRLSLEEVASGSAIAANTGLLIHATPQETLEFVISESGRNYNDNLLVPAVCSQNIGADNKAYVLTSENGTMLFTLMTDENRCVSAHSSWLRLADGASADKVYLALPGDETGVISIESDKNTMAGVFNIHGQSLLAPQKGINIINGRKVVVK